MNDRWVAAVALAAPGLCGLIGVNQGDVNQRDANQRAIFAARPLGLELLRLSGALTFAGLWGVVRPRAVPA